MFLIGLTGGIGSGKSTVSSHLQSTGIPIIDSDRIAREVVQPNSKCWKLIRKHFGSDAINHEDQQLNRAYLAQVVFSDPEKRQLLNRITHPEIQKRTLLKMILHLLAFKSFVVLDIPLLFESSIYKSFLSYILVVSCRRDQQLERIKARNGYSDQEAADRIAAQMPLEEKCRLADVVIDNSGTVEETIRQVEEIVRNLKYPISYWVVRALLILFYTVIGGIL